MKKFTLLFVGCLAGILSSAATTHSGSLPVLYINTENNEEITSKEYYLNATYYLVSNDPDIPSLGSAEEPIAMEIKARGNYTWTGFDKKPYKIKFAKKTEFMGMDKNKHFALMAHADDQRGFMRNIAGFELSRRLGLAWTPMDKPVEFYLNGDYKGLYFATQTIRVDETRVNITEQADEATTDVEGGWLVEIDNYDTDPHIDVMEPNGYPIFFTYKSPEVLSNEQRTYLSKQVNAMNSAIYNSDKASSEWLDYIDLESLVRFYIVQEILDDSESFHGSCYIYKDLGEGEKWHFGPVWDFGNTYQRGDKRKFIWQDAIFNPTWIGEIYKYPAFVERVKEVWREFCETGYAGIEEYLRSYASKITDASLTSYERWPQYGNDNVSARTEEFIAMMRRSMQWLGDQWGAQLPVNPDDDPDVFLRGEFTSWNATLPFTKLGHNQYELSGREVEGYAGMEFKVADADWKNIDFGGVEKGDTPTLNEEYELVAKGANMCMPSGFGTDGTIKLDLDNNTLLFSTQSGIGSIESTDQLEETTEIYTLTGQKVSEMNAKGVYILKYPSRTVKVIR